MPRALKLLARLVGAAVTFGGLIGVAQYFKWEPFGEDYPGWAFFVLVTVIVWLTVELALQTRIRKTSPRSHPNTLSDTLIAEVERMLREEDFQAILRHRKSLSRILWVEGRTRERVKLGIIAEEAAARSNERREQVSILIDDLGWTLLTIEDYKRAEQYLRHGLQIAQDLQSSFWIAKAHRHLAGLHLEEGAYDEATAELKQAIQAASGIDSPQQKTEMDAGLEYGLAVVKIRSHKLDEALKHIDRSEALCRENDDQYRMVKLHSLRGNIAELTGDNQSAKDHYRQGLERAKAIGRNDEIIRNRFGLARVFRTENDSKKAEQYEQSARVLMRQTHVPFEFGDEVTRLKRASKEASHA